MVKAIVTIDERTNRILNIIKAKQWTKRQEPSDKHDGTAVRGVRYGARVKARVHRKPKTF